MSWALHLCAAEGCDESLLVTARHELTVHDRFEALHRTGWSISRWHVRDEVREWCLCALHTAERDAGLAPLCSRCARPWCRCYRGHGPFEALGTAVRVSGRRVVKTYGAPAGTP